MTPLHFFLFYGTTLSEQSTAKLETNQTDDYFPYIKQTGSRLERYVEGAKKRQKNMRNRKVPISNRMEENATRLARVENEMKAVSTDDTVPEVE